ncbi:MULTISPECIES: ABC transporter ATP-binding protein [Devosia]|uniref:ABC transporter ATP-binding protein n=1 Tax=Devosia TaxID=46913 RepID=UPI000CE93DD5|nr:MULTISPECIES: ABC transporter ATP-binding protein [Devosia]AVF02602.1 peptide ABC transporter ATP-binding protein [Devosia sp. I507]
MTQTVLSVRDLATSFFTRRGEVQAVRGVSFDVRPGEILGLVGESGSGKSITCMSVLRLLKTGGRIKSGSANFEGTDLLSLDENALSDLRGNRIGVIFQDPMTSLNPTLTVGEQVMEAILRHRSISRAQARARAVELFELVRIPSAAARLKSYPHEFSGGMRQRVMIAIALACDPKLLIADEPTTALDVTIQRQILALLKDLQQRLGMAVILITHDLGVIAEVTDRVLVLYGGLVMETAPVRELFAAPGHPYTVGLLGAVPDLRDDTHRRLTPIPGSPPNMLAPPPGCPFAPRCPHAMTRCLAELPPLFGEGHQSRCWLQHPDAPKVDAVHEVAA